MDQHSTDREYFLDITADVCPLTFVKTKLMLEKMPSGAIAIVRLRGVEPLDNVPRSVKMQGHEVVSVRPESAAAAPSPREPHILTIRRK